MAKLSKCIRWLPIYKGNSVCTKVHDAVVCASMHMTKMIFSDYLDFLHSVASSNGNV
jgi:hypothetical protein